MGDCLKYTIGEEVDVKELGLSMVIRQYTNTGKSWRDTRPHAFGKGCFVAKYLGEGEWEWNDDMSHYELTARVGVELSLNAINSIDAHLSQEYFPEIAKKLRVELVPDKLYAVDGRFRVELYKDAVDVLESVEGMTFMECCHV